MPQTPKTPTPIQTTSQKVDTRLTSAPEDSQSKVSLHPNQNESVEGPNSQKSTPAYEGTAEDADSFEVFTEAIRENSTMVHGVKSSLEAMEREICAQISQGSADGTNPPTDQPETLRSEIRSFVRDTRVLRMLAEAVFPLRAPPELAKAHLADEPGFEPSNHPPPLLVQLLSTSYATSCSVRSLINCQRALQYGILGGPKVPGITTQISPVEGEVKTVLSEIMGIKRLLESDTESRLAIQNAQLDALNRIADTVAGLREDAQSEKAILRNFRLQAQIATEILQGVLGTHEAALSDDNNRLVPEERKATSTLIHFEELALLFFQGIINQTDSREKHTGPTQSMAREAGNHAHPDEQVPTQLAKMQYPDLTNEELQAIAVSPNDNAQMEEQEIQSQIDIPANAAKEDQGDHNVKADNAEEDESSEKGEVSSGESEAPATPEKDEKGSSGARRRGRPKGSGKKKKSGKQNKNLKRKDLDTPDEPAQETSPKSKRVRK
jgi:hypothetical protein